MRLLISPEVEAVLNRQTRRRLTSSRSGFTRCLVCSQPIGPDGEAAVVVIESAEGERRISGAHPACRASEVVAQSGLERNPGLSWAPAIHPGAWGRPPRAILAILHHRRLLSVDCGGEKQDQFVEVLVLMGFRPVENLVALPKVKVAGWVCRLATEGYARITSKEEVVELETETALPEEWLSTARSRGWITLIEVAGAPTGAAATEEVARAAAEGRAFAGQVRVTS
ncbi:MAG: hypothetical protein ACREP9_06980 [Candidatus Dormibacteraceae bacterium]